MTIAKIPTTKRVGQTRNAVGPIRKATLVPNSRPNQRKVDRISRKINSSKLGQKLQKVSGKARKLTSKIPTLKDPAKRQKAIERLERVNQRVIKRGTKAVNRFGKKLAQSGRKTKGPVMETPRGAGMKPTRPVRPKRDNKTVTPVKRARRKPSERFNRGI